MKKRLLLFVAVLFATLSSWAATLNVPSPYATIQAAVAAAIDGDVIQITDGTYVLTAPLYLNHELTITGQSEAGVIINATGTPPNSWGIVVNKSNSTLSNFTLIPNGTNGGYPIHAGDNTNPVQIISQVNLSHITINGAKKTAFDFNGVDNLTLSYLTATNTTGGNGFNISGCVNVNASHITTSGNAWGGFAVYSGNPANAVGRASDHITIDGGTSSFGETAKPKIYNQNEFGFLNTNITTTGFDYYVQNPISSVGYTFYFNDNSVALTYAASLTNPQNSVVKQISTGKYLVGTGMSIQAAINAANSGDVINVAAGTYNEDVNINKSISLIGADKTTTIIKGLKTAGSAASTVIMAANNITLDGFTITRDGNNPTDWNTTPKTTGGVGFNQVLTGCTVQNCIITGNRTGIYLGNTYGHTIKNNSITFNRTGIQLVSNVNNCLIENNEITNNWTVGVVVYYGVAQPASTNVKINHNNISGNWCGQVNCKKVQPNPTTSYDFNCNWYGTTSLNVISTAAVEPSYATQIPVAYGGTATNPGTHNGEINGDLSAKINYIPFSISDGGDCTGGLPIVTNIATPESTICGTLDVPVTVQNFTNVGAISLALNFDPAVLAYQSVTPNPAITSPSVSANSGQFRLGSFPVVPITLVDNAVLFTLHFNLQPDASGKTTNLNWSTVLNENEYAGPDGDPVYTSTFTNKDLTIPAKLYASATAPAITCLGGTTSVKVFATGGVAPYTGTGYFSVSAGTYNYNVTDAIGCTALASITIASPADEMVLTAAVTNVLCKDGTTGAIDLTVTGGKASSAPTSVDGVIGSEWAGASVTHVLYNPDAPTGNFGTPTNENHQVAYDIYTRQDSKFMYVGLKTVSASGGATSSAAAFANLYFRNGNTSTFGLEVTNDNAFIPGGASGFSLAGLDGTINEVFWNQNTTGAEYVIEVAIPFSFVQNDPLSMGFAKTDGIVPNDIYKLSLSQSFGYSVAGGQALYGNNRLGGFGIAPASTCTNTGYTYSWSNGATTQDLTGVAAGTYTVEVKDANCCSKSASFTILTTDIIPPVLTVPAAITVNQHDAKDPYATGYATATDCSGATVTYDDNRAELNLCNSTGTIVRTWSAKDFYNNTSTGTQVITVQDVDAPTVVVPTDITVNTDFGLCSAVVTYPAPTASDFGYFQGFENPLWVAGLAANNPSTDWNEYNSQIMRVVSGTDGITSKSGSAHAVINSTANILANTTTGAFGRLGGYNGTFGAGFISKVDVYFNMSDPKIATSTYGWDLDQAVSNNSAGFLRDFVYHVGGDNTGIYVCVSNSSNNGIPAMTPAYIKTQASFATITASGWYTMQWETKNVTGMLAMDFTIFDASGTLVWTTTISGTDAIATVGGNRYMWFNFVSADKLAIDNTSLVRKLAVTPASLSGTAFAKGETVVTVATQDACGHSASSSFKVTVVDNQAPVISTCASPKSAVVTTECGVAMPDFTGSITATDNCGVTSKTQVPAAGIMMEYSATPYVVTITATDDAGLSDICTSSFTVQKASISGILKYHKPTGLDDVSNADVALNNVDVSLYRSNNRTAIATVTTGSDGSYSFGNLCAGEYAIQITRNDKGVGGINATDAAKVNKWSTSGGSIEYVKFLAGDVDGNLYINNNDPQMIQAYFVNDNIKPNPTPFSRRPWSYWKKGVKISSTDDTKPGYFNVTVSGANVTDFNLYGMVTGDFNGSFIPDPTKAATWTLELNNNSMVNAGSSQEFELPLRAASAMQVGAVSMILNIPSGLVTVQDVKVNGSTDPVTWAINGNELRIGWYSSTPVDVAANGKLIALKLKTTNAFTTGETMDIKLKFDPLNELADGNYDVIDGASLLVAQVANGNGVTGIINPGDAQALMLSNYPNPFKGSTTVDYQLPVNGKVTIMVYNQIGQLVKTLVDGNQNAGDYSIRMDANNLMPGIYIAKLSLTNTNVNMTGTVKMSVLK